MCRGCAATMGAELCRSVRIRYIKTYQCISRRAQLYSDITRILISKGEGGCTLGGIMLCLTRVVFAGGDGDCTLVGRGSLGHFFAGRESRHELFGSPPPPLNPEPKNLNSKPKTLTQMTCSCGSGTARLALRLPSSLGSGVQGYLAHKKHLPPLGPPQGPRHGPTVGS